jgi:hypothetical protein
MNSPLMDQSLELLQQYMKCYGSSFELASEYLQMKNESRTMQCVWKKLKKKMRENL